MILKKTTLVFFLKYSIPGPVISASSHSADFSIVWIYEFYFSSNSTKKVRSGASAWGESISFLIKCSMLYLILHESKIIQDQWISFEIWALNPWFCEANYYFKYMAEECFMPVLAKLSVCDGKNGITMYCVFQ